MYLIWKLTPRRMLCGYRETKQEATNFVAQLQAKQKNAVFDIQERKK